MSNITVTSNNISRFTKRLQKAILEETGQKIPLNQASLIFSKMFGTNSIYELQQKLEKDVSTNNSISTEQAYYAEALEFQNKISNLLQYISHNKNSKIHDLFFTMKNNQIFLSFSSRDGYRVNQSFQPGLISDIEDNHFSEEDMFKLRELIEYTLDGNFRFIAHKYIYSQVVKTSSKTWPQYPHLNYFFDDIFEEIYLVVPHKSEIEINGSYLNEDCHTIYIDPVFINNYLKKGCFFITDIQQYLNNQFNNCDLYVCFRKIFKDQNNQQHLISTYYLEKMGESLIGGTFNPITHKPFDNIKTIQQINNKIIQEN